jgi:hypothetical protein
MKAVQIVRVGIATVLCILPSLAYAEISPTLRALLVEYRCQLVNRLERIHEFGDRASARDRFIAVTVPEHRHGYVQCMFIHGGLQMLCEASSGFYYDKEGSSRTFWLAPESVSALGRLGFSTEGSDGNFRMEFDVAARPDFNAIADLILTALHDGYGARAQTKLQFNAPFARRPNSSCIPVS